jgi:hypothetical protein
VFRAGQRAQPGGAQRAAVARFFGVTDALVDPTLELRDGNGVLLLANNNWQDDPLQASELTAAGLALTNPLESGMAKTLPPGPYTALLFGVNNGIGVGLVEVYDRGHQLLAGKTRPSLLIPA